MYTIAAEDAHTASKFVRERERERESVSRQQQQQQPETHERK
jgi:hypothetical protein